ncbi:hypothetical protein Tco_0798260 [Tanacetum coccineum]
MDELKDLIVEAQYGNEFAYSDIELLNSCGVSTRGKKVNVECEGESITNVTKTISSVLADDFDDVLSFTESRKGTKKYQNAKDAA